MELDLRDATIDDHDAYVRLFRELGIDDPVPSRARFGSDLAPRSIVAVARASGAVVGYGLYEILAATGYVRNVIADPAHRRAGIGRAVMANLRARFVAAGATAWCLNVKPDNAAAIALYEACGMARAHRAAAVRLARDIALPAPPADHVLVALPPALDPIVEPRFHLIAGQLASARTKSDRVVLALVRGDAADDILGIAVWNPSVPGAWPCRLAAPAHAATMFARLRERTADPAAPWVQLGVEDDEPARAAVLALGAVVNLEVLHMTGALA